MAFLVFILAFLSLNPAWSQEVHFFGSLDYARTTTKNNVEYVGIKNKFGSSGLSSAGINVSAKVDNKTQALVQVVHAPQPNKVQMDLIQLQRSFQHQFKVRVGLQRLPTFLKSEVIQVKALYPWANAPVEVYNQIPIKSFTGGSIEKEMGDFSLQLYFGDVKDEIFQLDRRTEVAGHNLVGSRLNFRRNNFDAYFNAIRSETDVTINTPVTIAPNVNGNAVVSQKVKDLESYTTGFSWDNSQWLIMSEFIHIHSRSSLIKTAQAGYTSLGYHFTEAFLLLGTFSTEGTRSSNTTPSKGTTYDLTAQYSIDLNTVIKINASHVNHRRHEVPSTLSATGLADTGNGLSGAPGGNFNVYDVQLAFVF